MFQSLSTQLDCFKQRIDSMPLQVADIGGVSTLPVALGSYEGHLWHVVAEYGLIVEENGTVRLADGAPAAKSEPQPLDFYRVRSGNWFGIFRDSLGRLVVVSDFFSMRSIFYSLEGDHLIVGSSFNGVSRARSIRASDSSIDWETVGPQLITTTNLFRTRASNITANSGIYAMWPDHILMVSARGAEVQYAPLGADPYSRDYSTLMQHGIERALASLRAVRDSGTPVTLNLSGGKDSRALLGLTLAAGVERSVEISTRDPRGMAAGPSRDVFSRDFHLATRLVDRYAMHWLDSAAQSLELLTFEESLRRWQRFRSNESFEIPARSSVSGRLESPTVLLMGIGGELIRSYLGNSYKSTHPSWWQRAHSGELTAPQSMLDLFRVLCKPWSVPEDFYKAMEAAFVRAFNFPGVSNGVEALDKGYLAYRSPSHAGAFDYNLSANLITLYPLCQPEFRWANSLLPPEDRDDGRVLYDIIAMTESELLGLEFASPPWPARFTIPSAGVPWDSISGEGAAASYDSAKSSGPRLVNADGQRLSNVEFMRRAGERIIENLSYVLEAGAFPKSIFESGFGARLALTVQSTGSPELAMLAKSESIRDVFAEREESLAILHIQLEGPSRTSRHLFAAAEPGSVDTASLREMISVSDVRRVSARIGNDDGGLLAVTVSEVPNKFEIAVYWYRDGERVQIDWYVSPDSDGVCRFMYRPEHCARYRATVFIRGNGLPEPSRTVETEEVSWVGNEGLLHG